MKASELIALLQRRIAEVGDRDMAVYIQTGADSWEWQDVTYVQLSVRGHGVEYCLEIETK